MRSAAGFANTNSKHSGVRAMLTRREILVAAVAVCTTLAAVAFAQTSTKPKLGSTTYDWQRLEVKPQKYGERREMFDAPTATFDRMSCHVTTLNPGERAHAPHRHPEEEIIIVKEGTLESM